MTFLPLIILPMVSILLFIAYLMVLVILRTLYSNKPKMGNSSKKISTLIILGSGGHTSEMLRLVSALNLKKYSPKNYIVAETDTSSKSKLTNMDGDSEILVIPRSREVGQTWISTLFTTINATMHCIKILWKYRPKLLLCNGPGTCVPPCMIAWLYNHVLHDKTTIVFVESICRIKTVSLTGKFLCHIADACLVQWPELATLDSRFKYIARFT